MKIAYLNARLLDPATGLDQQGGVLVEQGRIADVGSQLRPGDSLAGVTCVDVQGACLAPGLVDMQAGHTSALAALAQTAAAAGVTTLACLPQQGTTEPLDALAAFQHRASHTLAARLLAYAPLTKGGVGVEMTEMGLLQQAGALGFADGHASTNLRLMRRIMHYASSIDGLVVEFPLHPGLSEGGVMQEGEQATRLGLAAIPAEAEPLQVAIALRLAQATGCRLHLGPISMAESVALIQAAKMRGQRVTCSTAPCYFTLTDAAVADYQNAAKTLPPLRDATNRAAIAAAIGDGRIDAIASHHVLHQADNATLPFAEAGFGMAGLATLLPLTLALVRAQNMQLLDALATLTLNPATILRLPYGRLAKGAAADFVVFHLDAPPDKGAPPYETLALRGQITHTVLGGRQVFTKAAGGAAA